MGAGSRGTLKGIRAFGRAFLRGPIRGGLDRDDPRFWIVRRHKLDLHYRDSASSIARA
ncbi:MAG: hypothetical protein R3B67_03960 [Phycisphaerales bacterium]